MNLKSDIKNTCIDFPIFKFAFQTWLVLASTHFISQSFFSQILFLLNKQSVQLKEPFLFPDNIDVSV